MRQRRTKTEKTGTSAIRPTWDEVSPDQEWWDQLPAMSGNDEDDALQQEIDDIKSELAQRITHMMPQILSDAQCQILTAYSVGKHTQAELASALGYRSRASISFALFGNYKYSNDSDSQSQKALRTGGAIDKVRQWSDQDPICQQLTSRLAQAQEQLNTPHHERITWTKKENQQQDKTSQLPANSQQSTNKKK